MLFVHSVPGHQIIFDPHLTYANSSAPACVVAF